ncbi:hypothetical protein OsI_06500 [Oryza sativa Indica Group]|uniref:Uncharacterized protein n=1 Tax=Oryza sativa subsp. indica TaxID=39946 RepID=A2X2T6_ORYSI|nr:hypothetical protein OsI_06500 [Oryza sativa Indica Group]
MLEYEQMMNNLKSQYLHSFKQTCSGTVIQRYKLKVVPSNDSESGTSKDGKAKGDKAKDDEPKDAKSEGGDSQEAKNLQDQIDYAIYHALINQSGVQVNTLTNMIKPVVDGTIAEHQAKGPIILPKGVFPQYRNLVTGKQQPVSGIIPEQPMASTSVFGKPGASSSAQ